MGIKDEFRKFTDEKLENIRNILDSYGYVANLSNKYVAISIPFKAINKNDGSSWYVSWTDLLKGISPQIDTLISYDEKKEYVEKRNFHFNETENFPKTIKMNFYNIHGDIYNMTFTAFMKKCENVNFNGKYKKRDYNRGVEYQVALELFISNGYNLLTTEAELANNSRKSFKLKVLTPNDIIWYVTYSDFKNGKRETDICTYPYGERMVFAILNFLNIKMEMQKSTYIDKKLHKFDFFIEYNNQKYIIEYNGAQHYKKQSSIYSYYNDNDTFEKRQILDIIKEQYAKDNNINFLAIHYRKKFTDVVNMICKFLDVPTPTDITEEVVPKSGTEMFKMIYPNYLEIIEHYKNTSYSSTMTKYNISYDKLYNLVSNIVTKRTRKFKNDKNNTSYKYDYNTIGEYYKIYGFDNTKEYFNITSSIMFECIEKTKIDNDTKITDKICKIDIENGNLIETYNTLTVAANTLNIKNSYPSISNCCRGFIDNTYGFKWMLLKDYNKKLEWNRIQKILEDINMIILKIKNKNKKLEDVVDILKICGYQNVDVNIDDNIVIELLETFIKNNTKQSVYNYSRFKLKQLYENFGYTILLDDVYAHDIRYGTYDVLAPDGERLNIALPDYTDNLLIMKNKDVSFGIKLIGSILTHLNIRFFYNKFINNCYYDFYVVHKNTKYIFQFYDITYNKAIYVYGGESKFKFKMKQATKLEKIYDSDVIYTKILYTYTYDEIFKIICDTLNINVVIDMTI